MGIIIGSKGCSADEAFELLTRQSQHENRKLRDVAIDFGHQQAAFWTVDVAVRSRCWCLLRDGDSVRDRGWSAVADGWGARRVVLRLASTICQRNQRHRVLTSTDRR